MKIELSATPTKENDVEYSNCPFFFPVIIFHPFPVLKEDTFPSLPALSKHVIIKEKASGLLYFLRKANLLAPTCWPQLIDARYPWSEGSTFGYWARIHELVYHRNFPIEIANINYTNKILLLCKVWMWKI